MEQDPFIGRYYVGRRYLRENRLYHVLGTYMPSYNAKHVYRCETLDYDGDYAVKVEYDHIDMETAPDFFLQEITQEQYMRGIELFYQSVARIRQYILSMKGIPCDHIQIGKAYRCFDILYYNIKQNPKDLLVECESIKIEPSSVTLGNSWIPINFAKFPSTSPSSIVSPTRKSTSPMHKKPSSNSISSTPPFAVTSMRW